MANIPRMLSCDWGTSALRLRLVDLLDACPRIVAECRNDDGVASIAAASNSSGRAANFENVLRRTIDHLATKSNESLAGLPIVISGMASSSIGWISLPYANLPFDLGGRSVVSESLHLDGRAVLLISGVRDRHDVMRGEETELIGLMQLPEMRDMVRRCLVILPGTHSKHAEVSDGAMVSFRTLISGELYSVLSTHSILRHSVRAGDGEIVLPNHADGAARDAFTQGVREAIEGDLLNGLFRVRTRHVLDAQPPPLNAAFLSGLLIGSEIATLQRSPGEASIVLCAGSAVSMWYATALHVAGLLSRTVTIDPGVVDRLSAYGHAAIVNGA